MPNNLFRYLAAALVVSAAAACGDAASSAPTDPIAEGPPEAADVIEAETDDFRFVLGADGPVSSRVVPVRVTNSGDEAHQVVVARLHDGVATEDLLAAAQADGLAAVDGLVRYVGGLNGVEPGTTGEGWAHLEPGTHVLLCFVPSPDGISHLHKGMVREIEVVDDGTPVAPPEDLAGTITLADFAIGLPETGVGVAGVYAVENTGTEPHEAILLRMKDGKTLADAVAYAEAGMLGEPPYESAGGAGVVAPGLTAYVRLDLAPGSYLAVCVIESPAAHKAHVDLGMVTPFTLP
jgi:hypothetical protein